jgi:hypothetical protein
LQYRRVTTQSHTELAAELAADTEEYRMDCKSIRCRRATPYRAPRTSRSAKAASRKSPPRSRRCRIRCRIALARRALELEPNKRAQIVDEPDLAAYRDAIDSSG